MGFNSGFKGLKHSLAESEKQGKKSSLAEKFVSRVTR